MPADVVERAALPLHGLAGAVRLAEPELWEKMAGYRALCLGEQHDRPEHHHAQRRVIDELAARGRAAERPLAVGFEMFQRPYQAPLSSYVAGTLPEERLLEETEWRTRWGFDFALYRPLLEAARQHGLDALALNAPRELTRKISRSGLEALSAEDRTQLPQIDLDDRDHRGYFERAMSSHPMPAGGPRFDDMYAVQVVWDETMAETAGRWLEAEGASAQVIVVAGAGHCHRSAVPGRLSRRLNTPVLSVSAVFASELESFEDSSRYDLLLVLEDGGERPRAGG